MEIWEEKSTQIINVQLNEFSPTGHTHLNHLPKWVSEHCQQPWNLSCLVCHYPKENHDFNFYHHRLILPQFWASCKWNCTGLPFGIWLCSLHVMFMRLVHLVMYSQASFFSLVYGIALYEYPTISFSILFYYWSVFGLFPIWGIFQIIPLWVFPLMSLGTHEHAFQLSNYQDGIRGCGFFFGRNYQMVFRFSFSVWVKREIIWSFNVEKSYNPNYIFKGSHTRSS